MEFGKLADISLVDFSLPEDAPENLALFGKFPAKPHATKLFAGATGWTTKEWIGSYYPASCKAKDFLLHYGKLFNSIELNSTHYATPSLATLADWKQKTPMGFKFSPKIPQIISHHRNLLQTGDELARFADAMAVLEEKLGVCFLQLPPTFSPDRLNELTRFLHRFPHHQLRLAVELRQAEWFEKPQWRTALFDLLEQTGTGAVITDVAGRRDVLHQRITAPFVVLRFVGNGLHPSDYQRLCDWAMRLKTWQEQPIREIYFFLHQPDNILVPDAMQYFAPLVNSFLEQPIPIPEKIIIQQLGLF